MEEEKNLVTNGNNKGSSKAIIIIMGLIILILASALLVLLLTGNGKKNTNNGNETEKPKEYEIKVKELEFPEYACGGLDFTIGKGTLNVENMSAKEKLGMLSTALLELVDKDTMINNDEIYQGMELDFNIVDEAKKYFDLDSEMLKQIEEGFGTGFYVFNQKNNKSYLRLIIGGCIGPENEGYYIKLKESKKDKNIYIKTYYYAYAVNDEIESDDEFSFTTTYYKEKGDKDPVVKNLSSRNELNFELFNTFDVYYDITDGNMKLIKVVYNTK